MLYYERRVTIIGYENGAYGIQNQMFITRLQPSNLQRLLAHVQKSSP